MSDGKWPRRNCQLPISNCQLAILVLLRVASGNLSGTYSVELTYDDNPFKLSRMDLVEFRRSENPARLPFRTADDLDVLLRGRLAWQFRPTGRLGLSTRLHQFVRNWEKSYGVGGVEVEQRLGRQLALKVSCVYVPNYLIRYYRNSQTKDTGDYAACRFSEFLPGLELEARAGRLRFRPRCRLEFDDYMSVFDHYDSRVLRPGASLLWSPVRNLDLSADYEYLRARARGPVPDISHTEHSVKAGLTARPVRQPRLSFGGAYSWSRRAYTTADAEGDPAHAGRVDVAESADLEASYDFGRVRVRAGYGFEWRSVTSPYQTAIEDIKDYWRSRLTLGVTLRPDRRRRENDQ